MEADDREHRRHGGVAIGAVDDRKAYQQRIGEHRRKARRNRVLDAVLEQPPRDERAGHQREQRADIERDDDPEVEDAAEIRGQHRFEQQARRREIVDEHDQRVDAANGKKLEAHREKADRDQREDR